MSIVNVKEANDHLRLAIDLGTDFDPDEFDPEDYPNEPDLPDLIIKIGQAEAIVLDYLKVADTSPAWEPRQEEMVKAAVLLILGSLWRDREDNSAGGGGRDMLSERGAVTRLLVRMRDPALA